MRTFWFYKILIIGEKGHWRRYVRDRTYHISYLKCNSIAISSRSIITKISRLLNDFLMKNH